MTICVVEVARQLGIWPNFKKIVCVVMILTKGQIYYHHHCIMKKMNVLI